MSDPLAQYLTDSYRRDILGESVRVEMPAAPKAELIAAARKIIGHIDALRLGPNLASRDFVSYQNRRALVTLLAQLEAQTEEQSGD